jgi:rRNA-processing protein FCF1
MQPAKNNWTCIAVNIVILTASYICLAIHTRRSIDNLAHRLALENRLKEKVLVMTNDSKFKLQLERTNTNLLELQELTREKYEAKFEQWGMSQQHKIKPTN